MKYIYVLLLFGFALNINAQKYHLEPCGTPSVRSAWLKNYQKNPNSFQKRTGVVMWVPISVTLVGDDEGKGYLSERSIHESLCTLNDDFAGSDIQFYLAQPLRYMNSSVYADHSNILQGAQLMFDNNFPDMINNYVMVNAAGNCGYNLPYAGIALSNNCMQGTDHTWAHEIGHALSVQHTFLGWEGGVSHDFSVAHNYNDPAPETVLYDYTYFKSTLVIDTLIIDTAYVEKIDGSNCQYAADGFCDTKPDYIAARWECDENGNNLVQQTDPNGEKFFSDGSNIMSYALDNCSYKFTEEQIGAMRANLIDEKPTYLGNENPLEMVVDGEYNVTSPTEYLEEVYYKDVYLEWEPVENATLYSIQVARTSSYGLTVFDTIINTPFVTISEMRFKNNKHYFRVKGLNEYSFCSDFHAAGAFETTDTETSIDDKYLSTIKINPTLLEKGQNISISNAEGYDFELGITNLVGQQLFRSETSEKFMQISTDNWDAGIYIVSFRKGQSVITNKIAITQ